MTNRKTESTRNEPEMISNKAERTIKGDWRTTKVWRINKKIEKTKIKLERIS